MHDDFTDFIFRELCSSREYPYLPHGRDFFLRPPPPIPLEIPIELHTFL